MKLKNKTVLITGASSGIGRSCALAFAAHGADLILLARRTDRLQSLAQECHKANVKTHCLTVDIRQQNQLQETIQQLPKPWCDIDILINNAGLAAGLAPVQEGDLTDWQRMIETNISGLITMTRLIVPGMLQRNQGHIINIGSIAGHEVYPKGAVYCATKHAVKAFSQGLKLDLLGSNVRVTSIDPGLVNTEFSLVRFAGDASKAESVYHDMTPLAADDIADACCYAATRPPHVNISEMIILATDQSSATHVHRHQGER